MIPKIDPDIKIVIDHADDQYMIAVFMLIMIEVLGNQYWPKVWVKDGT